MSKLLFRELVGKRVIVTGASKGIGRATANLLAQHGANVGLISRSEEPLRNFAKDLSKYEGTKHFYRAVDVNDTEKLVKNAQELIDELGGLDILVNNAGGFTSPEQVYGYQHVEAMIKLNTTSAVALMEVTIPHMLNNTADGGDGKNNKGERGSKGSIINMSSVAAKDAVVHMPNYCAAKAALDAYTRCYALAYAPQGIRINSVNPGTIETSIFDNFGDWTPEQKNEFLQVLAKKHPIGRIGDAEEVAELVLMLANHRRSSFITGQTIAIDGGQLLTNSLQSFE